MSLPRPIHPGSRYLVTRRTAHRQLLLRPSVEVNQILLYALAYAVLCTGIQVHAFVALSNHIHVVVTDPDARLPQFLHLLNRHIACCMNALLGRTENFWSSNPASAVVLSTDDDVLDKIAYVIANPTAAGLVAEPSEWPGVITPACGMRTTVSRPPVFFSPKGKMPASIDLDVVVPQLESYDGPAAIIARVQKLVEEKLAVARETLAAEGRSFLGRARVLSADTSSSPSTQEPKRARRPQVAARTREQRRSALDRLRVFHAHYGRALHAWRAGDRGVVFPAGTYLMRVRHGVVVEPAPG